MYSLGKNADSFGKVGASFANFYDVGGLSYLHGAPSLLGVKLVDIRTSG
tara:strand:+ start:4416 stop:4562 length:147 start_codon:yes stop_codon:yes gene_type:complete